MAKLKKRKLFPGRFQKNLAALKAEQEAFVCGGNRYVFVVIDVRCNILDHKIRASIDFESIFPVLLFLSILHPGPGGKSLYFAKSYHLLTREL